MGDRGNIYFKQAEVFLYSHWTGSDLSTIARDALKRAPDRWDDEQYLPAIVFRQMVGRDIDGTTGFGISHTIGDNQHPVIVIDQGTQEVSVTNKGRRGSEEVDTTSRRAPIKFADFIKMTDEACRAWHLGKDE